MGSCDSCGSKDSCPSASAGGSCGSSEPESLIAPLHEKSSVKKVIGVCSGKGGVGKSFVTSVLASRLARDGYRVAILDADVTGPSIPKAFGLKGQLKGDENGILPMTSHSGIQIVSVNLVMENEEAPVVWRGPVISGVVKQFWSDVIWENIDVMLIDMPPGTGDVPLTVFQSIPLDPDITALVDEGHIEKVPNEILSGAVEFVEKMLEEKK